MRLAERSYSGKTFRPKPFILHSESDSTLIVATSWGQPEEAQSVAQIFLDQIQLGESQDQTSPFEYLENLGPIGNKLKIAAQLSNEYLYRNSNQSEYVSGVEVLALAHKDNVLSWAQVGGPHLLLFQKDKNESRMLPLATQFDWSWQFNQESPLPSQCLGLQRTLSVLCGTIQLESGSDLFLVCRGSIPATLFEKPQNSLTAIAKILAAQNVETPFWLGHVKI